MAETSTSVATTPTTAPISTPSTVSGRSSSPSNAPSATMPAQQTAARGTVPAPGARPAVGSPPPVLPPTVRQVAAAIRSVGRNLRVEVSAPKGALVHVYRDGQLVRSVTPEEAKALTIPANGATQDDVQIVVVTRTGDVMSTPVPESGNDTGGAGTSTDPLDTATTEPASSVTPPTVANSTRSRNGARTSNARAGAVRTSPTTTVKPSSGKSAAGRSGQRSTNDTVTPNR